ncbi:MlaE family ABC transporter permease [Chitiniphilus eburneus]|uniref:ABC transporter permease n=1 Tax=Chitiniphilus eburneus TaxID=2571148 RepID=A0A4U0Q796_9NEIS|nr:ABC transporter permease [Chitiniphilus eburneus]TJZ76142.1 ABC transporter permease [Chitiniphilus eburneus]
MRFLLPVISSLFELRRPPVRRVLLKQIYFTGNEAAWIMLLIGFALGGIVVSQLHDQYGQSREAAMRLLAALSFRELTPLMVGLVLIARSSSAVASELASMRVHGELRSLMRYGIDPVGYLVLPRVLGMTLAATLLGFLLALSAQLGGAFFVSGVDATYQLFQMDRIVTPAMVGICLGKSALFGFAASTLACVVGLRAKAYVTEIPKASSRAVVRGLVLVFLLDLIWAVMS